MLKVVHVQWEDPCFAGSGWMTQNDFESWANAQVAVSDSVGILAHENESFIVLLQSIGQKQVADALKISRTAIVKITELGEVPITLENQA